MTKPLDEHSPHYSIKQKRICRVLNLVCQLSRCDDLGALGRAHRAVQWLAKQDADHATLANGLGFSKSDSVSGRNLAMWPTERVILSTILGPMAVRLARKYRRQLPHEYLVDRPKQRDLKSEPFMFQPSA